MIMALMICGMVKFVLRRLTALATDRLPLSDSAIINWWQKNQSSIREKYHISAAEAGPLFMTIYAFGDGYKEEGQEDRLYFDGVKPPRNCIDKNIFMSVNRTRDGDTTFSFEHTKPQMANWLNPSRGSLVKKIYTAPAAEPHTNDAVRSPGWLSENPWYLLLSASATNKR